MQNLYQKRQMCIIRRILIISKYLVLPVVFFLVEVITHGNEYIPLVLVVLFSILLYIYSKNREIEIILYIVGLALGMFVEVGLTVVDSVQVWENSSLLSVPLWLPFAWGIGSVLFYKLGKDLENK